VRGGRPPHRIAARRKDQFSPGTFDGGELIAASPRPTHRACALPLDALGAAQVEGFLPGALGGMVPAIRQSIPLIPSTVSASICGGGSKNLGLKVPPLDATQPRFGGAFHSLS
jgi:hypothetical protein